MSSSTEIAAPSPPDAAPEHLDPRVPLPQRRLRPVRRWRPSRVGAVIFIAGILATAALVVTTIVLYQNNESRLLGLRARELGLVLTAAVPPIQTPLASASELARATGGSAQKFRAFVTPLVGAGRQFTSASLWRVRPSGATLTAVVGTRPVLASQPQRAQTFFAQGAKVKTVDLIPLLHSSQPAIGYAFRSSGAQPVYAVYAETPLPKTRRSKLERNTAFSDLDYAIYLGGSQSAANLLVTSLKRLPVTSRHASDSVPFGNSSLTLVVTPRGSLGGAFLHSLPWIVAGFGLLISLAAAFIADRLARGRLRAEQLAVDLDRVAAENEQMYTEQRNIAQTLQHALLPDALPKVRGLGVSARYVPAGSGIEVGGDWYDVVAAGENRVLLVIGDVSGHGLRAATTMASLRHATLAYAADDASPGVVLSKLSGFVNRTPHEYFATVLCAMIDVESHRLTVASAGHLPPLLIDGDDGRFLELDVSVPIGVSGDFEYHETSLTVPANAILVAFTDGLVERREETVDTGMERLRAAAVGRDDVTLEQLVAELSDAVALGEHRDDTAIVGVQWQS
ncbi:MAG TPA: PP2C family protein-serine/threonine phosphatase [Solirubrobacteraceae bacterium]